MSVITLNNDIKVRATWRRSFLLTEQAMVTSSTLTDLPVTSGPAVRLTGSVVTTNAVLLKYLAVM